MLLADRLKDRLQLAGLSQSELARRVKVAQPTIAKLVMGQSAGSSHLHKIARELGTTPQYLTGETDDPMLGALPVPTPEMIAEFLDLVPVEEISLEFGMGATVMTDEFDRVVRWMPREWLENYSSSPSSLLTFARGRGESMAPTILNRDLVLIDRGDTLLTEQDLIWACGYGDLGGIKRLRSVGGGQIKIMSDNAAVSDEIIPANELRIIGRVCANLRKM